MATLLIAPVGGSGSTTRVRSAGDGRFRVTLTAGTYTVKALPQARSPFPRPPSPRRVQVRAGRFTTITVVYDTGIR